MSLQDCCEDNIHNARRKIWDQVNLQRLTLFLAVTDLYFFMFVAQAFSATAIASYKPLMMERA